VVTEQLPKDARLAGKWANELPRTICADPVVYGEPIPSHDIG